MLAFRTADGAVRGVPAATEASPVPASLTPLTRTRYAVPFVKPVRVVEVVALEVSRIHVAGLAASVCSIRYEVGVSEAALHERSSVPLPG